MTKLKLCQPLNKPNEAVCFICGSFLHGEGLKLLDARTACMGVPLPDKLGTLIGKEFLVIVSKADQVCKRCVALFDRIDELEHNLDGVKRNVIVLLQKKYKILNDINGEKEFNDKINPAREIVHSNSGKVIVNGNQEATEHGNNVPNHCFTCDICFFMFDKIDDWMKHKKVHEIKRDLFTEELEEPDMVIHQIENDSGGKSLNVKEFIETFNIGPSEPEIAGTLNDLTDNSNEPLVYEVSNKKECRPCDDIYSSEDLSKLYLSCSSKLNPRTMEENPIENNVPSSGSVELIQNVGSETVSLKGNLLVEEDDLKNSVVSILTPSIMFKCSVREFKSSTKDAVELHSQSHFVEGKSLLCSICDMPFPSNSILSRHFKVHERSTGPVKCTVCNFDCHDSLHLMYHHKNKHNVLKQLNCASCDENFNSNKDLKTHILLVHPNNKTFVCPVCNLTFKRHTQFENHKLYAHGNKKCRICNKHISNAIKLRQHENRHARIDMKRFDCDKCGRSFKSPGGLRVHKVSHTGEYKFFCEYCGRGFMSSVILEEHKGVHTKEERYVCDKCGRKFVLYSTFHLHKQWHMSPFPFPCSLCGKKFKYRSERSNHVRKNHTGEHPHKCSFCTAEFLRAAYLKRHLSLHTKQYPYNCDICKKGFDQRRGLGRHLARVHKDTSLLGTEPKKCQYKVALRPDEYPASLEEKA